MQSPRNARAHQMQQQQQRTLTTQCTRASAAAWPKSYCDECRTMSWDWKPWEWWHWGRGGWGQEAAQGQDAAQGQGDEAESPPAGWEELRGPAASAEAAVAAPAPAAAQAAVAAAAPAAADAAVAAAAAGVPTFTMSAGSETTPSSGHVSSWVLEDGTEDGVEAPAQPVERQQPVPREPAEHANPFPEGVAAAALWDAVGPVAAREGPAYDLDYFTQFRDFTGHWSQHNAALKYFVEEHEHPTDPFAQSCTLNVPRDQPTAVAVILPHKKGSGTDWQFNRAEQVPWDWREMVAQLRDEDIRRVLTGAQDRVCGLVGCDVAVRHNSHDHLRQKAFKDAGRPMGHKLPVWDFVLHRDDGTGVRLHPRRTQTHVDTCALEPHEVEVPIPPNGLGSSGPPGTFKWYKNVGLGASVRFDPQKLPLELKGKGKGKGKGQGKGKAP